MCSLSTYLRSVQLFVIRDGQLLLQVRDVNIDPALGFSICSHSPSPHLSFFTMKLKGLRFSHEQSPQRWARTALTVKTAPHRGLIDLINSPLASVCPERVLTWQTALDISARVKLNRYRVYREDRC